MLKRLDKIGIVGGGQLGMFIANAAKNLGFQTHVFADSIDDPAVSAASKSTIGNFSDLQQANQFVQDIDIVTFEFENIPVELLDFFETQDIIVSPSAEVMRITQNRGLEKSFLIENCIPVVPNFWIKSIEDLSRVEEEVGLPCVIKTVSLGYDGKGQTIVSEISQLGDFNSSLEIGIEYCAEAFVDFDFEVSVIVARNEEGGSFSYDVIRNIHVNHILHKSIVPADINESLSLELRQCAVNIADSLGHVGVMTVEFFILKDGGYYVNEIAPRVHNSGHWTLDACTVSQFDQHVRAITGLPFGGVSRYTNIEMENLLGHRIEESSLKDDCNWKWYDYGKLMVRPGRKMGHRTRILGKKI